MVLLLTFLEHADRETLITVTHSSADMSSLSREAVMATINSEVLQEAPKGLSSKGFFLVLLHSALYGNHTTCTIFSHLNLPQLPHPCAFAQAVPALKFLSTHQNPGLKVCLILTPPTASPNLSSAQLLGQSLLSSISS